MKVIRLFSPNRTAYVLKLSGIYLLVVIRHGNAALGGHVYNQKKLSSDIPKIQHVIYTHTIYRGGKLAN